MGFYLSRAARGRFGLSDLDRLGQGGLRVGGIGPARELAHRLNRKRARLGLEGVGFKASHLHALSLLGDLLGAIVDAFLSRHNPRALRQALTRLDAVVGRDAVDRALLLFASEFAPDLLGEAGVELPPGVAAAEQRRVLLLRELLIFWGLRTTTVEPPIAELIDDSSLRQQSRYLEIIAELRRFFAEQTALGPAGESLLEVLEASPSESLADRLRRMGQHWAYLFADSRSRLLAGLDFITEEEAPRFPPGPGPARRPVFRPSRDEEHEARYSPDWSWMANLVLLAKHTNVWLDQLSRSYGRPVRRLDEIPGAELDLIAERGFTGLWLIGLWERSPASQRIKRLCGNPEAQPSAYSINDYRIAGELGGEAALERLQEEGWRRGIRIAADMVPNHMGIDSRWVIEHPERFLSTDRSPFPAYSFTGPDLSSDPAVGIFIEDRYYDRGDAAVVFLRLDRRSGERRYIYHGNDGTGTPWNDTAQLDYLNPHTRAAVLRTILGVLQRFSVVRFDAAMTLTKRHYQRLWFPQPGTAGAIPSRAEHAMTREQFDERMPLEFWREVVEAAAAEAPGALLLAEAFWLMEGYFVRSLGMHRVYNSAFMNMLRERDNAGYRKLLKEILVYDPEILRRYVNFVNNPDERTAVDQFGKGDRYFGVCTMMVTLPGLPMFGHGQVEGFAEKYGMEYGRAYWDEAPDAGFVGRHAGDIFPLLRQRQIFAGVDNFLLFDFGGLHGEVNEDVYAYCNGSGADRVLVVFNNSDSPARGSIRLSALAVVGTGSEGKKKVASRTLAHFLDVEPDTGLFCLFRDQVRGLEYLRPSDEIARRGLALELEPFQYAVFRGFHQLADDQRGSYARLWERVRLRGIGSVEHEKAASERQRWRAALARLASPEIIRRLEDGVAWEPGSVAEPALIEGVQGLLLDLLSGLGQRQGADLDRLLTDTGQRLRAALTLPVAGEVDRSDGADAGRRRPAVDLRRVLKERPQVMRGLLAAILLEAFEAAAGGGDRLRAVAGDRPEEAFFEALSGDRRGLEILASARRLGWGREPEPPPRTAARLARRGWQDDEIRRLAGGAAAEGGDPQRTAELCDWRLAFEALSGPGAEGRERAEAAAELEAWWAVLARLRRLASRLERQRSAATP